MKNLFLFLFVFGILLSVANAQSIADLIKQADEFTEQKFDNAGAIRVLEKAYSMEPNNFDVLWRLSRAYVDYGEHLPDKTDAEKDKQLSTFEKALDFANKAVNANPSNMVGYLRRAIANGKIALFKGVFKTVSLVKEVKSDVEKAISLKNGGDIQLSVAHYVLGRSHAKVCEKP
ncbi:MAG: hypothetical protein N3A61_09570, partial [Ignavibacteria bacterium]|nr:hypothetical protein [Ignavibacteria bacterium]